MTWTKRVAPGVETLRFRADNRLSYITSDAELIAAAGTIEELAARLDRLRVSFWLFGWIVLLCGFVAVFRG